MIVTLIILGILVFWAVCARIAIIRERDYNLWRYYCTLGPNKAWEDEKAAPIFCLTLLGPIGLLIVFVTNKTTGEKILDGLKNKQCTSYDLHFYEEHIEHPYYKKYKINPCDYCGKKDCGIDVYDKYVPCKVFEVDNVCQIVGKRRI